MKKVIDANRLCNLTLPGCGLDLNLAQSGCKFDVEGRTILQALLRRSQRNLCLITVVIAKSKAKANKCLSQAHSHRFSSLRQTYVPKAPNSSPIRTGPNHAQCTFFALPLKLTAAKSIERNHHVRYARAFTQCAGEPFSLNIYSTVTQPMLSRMMERER